MFFHSETISSQYYWLFFLLFSGSVGGVCALANVLGEEVCKLYNLYKEGKFEEAKSLQLKMVKPNGAVSPSNISYI